MATDNSTGTHVIQKRTNKRKGVKIDYHESQATSQKLQRNKRLKKSQPSSSCPQKASLKGDVPPLAKFLASNDKKTRDRAIDALNKFLSHSKSNQSIKVSNEELFSAENQTGADDLKFEEEISADDEDEDEDERLCGLELGKLYKGLFYCYWMSDKPIVQQELAQELSTLCLVVRPMKLSADRTDDRWRTKLLVTRSGLKFWNGFWEALNREWHGVDRHRIDKYLLLMRRFVGVGFRLLQRIGWRKQSIALWSQILKSTIFNVSDHKTCLSITYHYIDIFLEELNLVISLDPKASDKRFSILEILDPIFHALSNSQPGTATFLKLIEEILDPIFAMIDQFVNSYNTLTQSESQMNESLKNNIKPPKKAHQPSFNIFSSTSSETDHLKSLRVDLLSIIFKIGSDAQCLDSNRKKIYNYWISKGGKEVLDDDDDVDVDK
ncbi:nucleolar protein,Nop52-domain-containing protein [Phakopsora pachyrhizi]|uniref:Nucleolar protein,Nop52-domain-containing protein n=1 Tax=Phakopsora pachyrhizi TaxID=170000 RepID=A0AAV0BPQ4_PHAPC|nr:nucleolar protein,Nop52-domain-containing protein [Phakopsora pachyrhizi]KAI8459338.1 nucleolar protein,Nop52-domain-containing protein [Phakopsora pachyrhizi]CAH7688333.1 nucleolar protein,Nop52-domain-containing protein [Phakopsora pachyrhizi]